MIQAVIFDMDGLLIDSEPLWQEIESTVFTRVLNTPITKEMTRQTMGLRIDEAIQYWYSTYPFTSPTKKEVETEIMKAIVTTVKEEGKAMPGVYELITMLKEKNIPMSIASSSHMDLIDAVVDTLKIRQDMQVLQSAEYEPYGKPHPGVYLSAAKALGYIPKNCLVFEDSPNGVLAAKAAQMMCIAVPSKDVKNDKRFVIADKVISSLEDFSFSDIL